MKGLDHILLDKAGVLRASRRSGPCIRAFAVATVAAGLISACGPAGNDPGPGGVTIDEAEALEQAAEMIEARQPPPELLDGVTIDAPLPPTAPDEEDAAESDTNP